MTDSMRAKKNHLSLASALMAATFILLAVLVGLQDWRLNQLQAQMAFEQQAKAAEEAKQATLKADADAEMVAFKERYKDQKPTVTGLQRFDKAYVTTFTNGGEPFAAVHFADVWLEVPLKAKAPEAGK